GPDTPRALVANVCQGGYRRIRIDSPSRQVVLGVAMAVRREKPRRLAPSPRFPTCARPLEHRWRELRSAPAAQPLERAPRARASAKPPPNRACRDETSAIGSRVRKPVAQTA